MSDKTFSNTRTKSTWKPRVGDEDLPFYEYSGEEEQAEEHRELFLGLGTNEPAFLSDPGRNPVFNLPYAAQQKDQDNNATSGSGGEAMKPMRMFGLEDLPEGISFNYAIMGGYNSNAIEVSWNIDAPAYRLQWVALKTFTGIQLKYVTPKKRSPLIFALADEDAYVYCDESPCLECVFMCKRGFVIYANVAGLGLVKFPLTRASAYWESRN